jgi:hypothetical protein
MKNQVYPLVMLMMIAFFPPTHNLIGHWITNGENNSKVYVDFNKNGTFKVSTNGKIENEDRYKFTNDTIWITDRNCGEKVHGKYNIIFYTDDSATFKVITDPCLDRAGEINGGVIVRQPK